MKDLRLERLARMLLTYSLDLRKGQLFQISGGYQAKPLIKALLSEAADIGAIPYVKITDAELTRLIYGCFDADKPDECADVYNKQLDWETAYWRCLAGQVVIGVDENDMELAGVDPRKLQARAKALRPLNDLIIDERRWVYLNWPTMAQAQKAGMCYDDFFEFFIDVCLVDYRKMAEDFVPLKALMERTDCVRILGPNGTDLAFSIKGIPVVPCAGLCNIPDGEIYTAPVRGSVNGVIQYNTVTNMHGKEFKNPKFTFKDGKIVTAQCENDTDGLNRILDTDEGARYIGEFALGVNNRITRPFGNTLYDEKIGGSFHLTPGNAYAQAPNGNKSAIHWDIVCIQTKEYGGGEIYFDGELIRKDGLFIPEKLRGLNP